MDSNDTGSKNHFLRDPETFKLAVESSDLGVWGFDYTTREITWSRKLYELMGVEPGTRVEGDTFRKYIHPDDLEWVVAEIDKSLDENKPYDVEYRVVRADTGETIWVRLPDSPFTMRRLDPKKCSAQALISRTSKWRNSSPRKLIAPSPNF